MRREVIGRLGVTSAVIVGASVLYALVPMTGRLWWLAAIAGPIAGVVLAPFAVSSSRRIMASDSPVLAVGNALVLSLLVVVLGFATTYYALAQHDSAQFDGLDTKVDALYFTVTTLSTVGYGDISAQGQLARGVVVGQIAVNFLFAVGFVGIIRWAGKRRVDTGPSELKLRDEIRQQRGSDGRQSRP